MPRSPRRGGGLDLEPDGPVEHAVVAAAEAFGTSPEVLLGADRSRRPPTLVPWP
ncbi:hypothetical protein [Nocardioides daphniae]|uniref:hypothetical protein n=1 Tax=Nocardioides daphniae TaxID=402297 RepID=UPI001315A59E|nr:hypothetical protein [Nocardioides daphniae]